MADLELLAELRLEAADMENIGDDQGVVSVDLGERPEAVVRGAAK
jgi:hypothetical protein